MKIHFCDCWECRAERAGVACVLVLVIAFCISLLLSSCTVSPDVIDQAQPTIDASAPPSYPIADSGILGESADKRTLYITPKLAAARYPMATPFVDATGNHIFQIPSDAYAAWYTGKITAQKTALEKTK